MIVRIRAERRTSTRQNAGANPSSSSGFVGRIGEPDVVTASINAAPRKLRPGAD